MFIFKSEGFTFVSNKMDSFVTFQRILNIFLLILCIALLVQFITINVKLQNCEKISDNDDDDDNKDKLKCPTIENAIAKDARRWTSYIGFPYPANITLNINNKLLFNLSITNWLVEEANVTKRYNTRALQYLIQQFSTDAQVMSVQIPKIIAYLMVVLGLKRDETVEKLLIDIVKKLGDPLKTSNYYDRLVQICYRVILQNYQTFNKLSLYEEQPAVKQYIEDTLDTAFQYSPFPLDPTVGKLPDNFYRNKKSGEIGTVFESKANGIRRTVSLVEPLFYVGMSDKLVNIKSRKMIKTFFNFAYHRLRFTSRYNFVQTRGADESVLSPNYRSYLLSVLSKLYLHNPLLYTPTTDQFDALQREKTFQIWKDSLCSVGSTNKILSKINYVDSEFLGMLVTSRSEGFTFFSYEWFVFEQCFATSYINFDSNFKSNITSYINYGCDFSPLLRRIYKFDSYDQYYLPGQMLDENKTRQVPNAGSMVQLDKYLYYQSTYVTPTLRVNGVVDGKTKTHRAYIRSTAACTYYLFGWYSTDYIPIVKHEEQYFLFDRNVRISLRCANAKGANPPDVQLKSVGFYNSFFVNVPKDADYTVTVSLYRNEIGETNFAASEAANVERINDYEIGPLDSSITITPDKYKDKITVVKHKSTGTSYVIDDNTLLNTDSPATASRNNAQYAFSNMSMSRFAVVPKS